MGHHALAHGRFSLFVGKQWLDEREREERESGWFESKRSQSIHGQHKNMQMRSALKVTPHPPYIVFPRGFKPLVKALAPFTLSLAHLRVLAPFLGL